MRLNKSVLLEPAISREGFGFIAQRQATKGSNAARRRVSCEPMLYFDHNATTPLCPAAREAWLEASEQFVGNPSSPTGLGPGQRALAAREQLAAY